MFKSFACLCWKHNKIQYARLGADCQVRTFVRFLYIQYERHQVHHAETPKPAGYQVRVLVHCTVHVQETQAVWRAMLGNGTSTFWSSWCAQGVVYQPWRLRRYTCWSLERLFKEVHCASCEYLSIGLVFQTSCVRHTPADVTRFSVRCCGQNHGWLRERRPRSTHEVSVGQGHVDTSRG